jgi:hypothetical protein
MKPEPKFKKGDIINCDGEWHQVADVDPERGYLLIYLIDGNTEPYYAYDEFEYIDSCSRLQTKLEKVLK